MFFQFLNALNMYYDIIMIHVSSHSKATYFKNSVHKIKTFLIVSAK